MRNSGPIILALVFIAAFLLPAPVSADTVCSICGRTITGNYYVTSQNQVVCSECAAKYPACAGCGLVSRSLIDVDGAKYCRECYLKLPRCGICGKPITGGYDFYPDIGLKVCFQCEKTSPRCENCARPVKELTMVGSTGLCERCAANVPKCRSCGNALLSDYTFFEGDDSLKYCSECVSKYPPCADCGAPSGPAGTKLDDGRYLCPDCMKTALFDAAPVTAIKLEVLAYLKKNMGMNIEHQVSYSMRGKDFLDEKSNGMHKDLNGLFYRRGDDFNIYVLYGLRMKDLIWVLSHEISHAWQAENTSGELDLVDLEGFAQWAAYHALKNFGYDRFAGTMTTGEGTYATGLKRMLSIEGKGGSRAVFDYIKSK